MKKQYAISLFVASLLIVTLAAVVGSGRNGGDLPAPPAIGAMIDDFKLPDADGAQHTLNSLKGKNGAVIIFIATRCPVSNGYNDRMEKLAQDYQAKGIKQAVAEASESAYRSAGKEPPPSFAEKQQRYGKEQQEIQAKAKEKDTSPLDIRPTGD